MHPILAGMRRAAPLLLLAAASHTIAAPDSGGFGNSRVSLSWQPDGHLSGMRFADHANGRTILITAPFALRLADGTVLTPAQLSPTGEPKLRTIAADPAAARLAERRQRSEYTQHFNDPDGRFDIAWTLTQVADAPYLRAALTVTAVKADEAIPRIDLLQAEAPGAMVMGRVDGSPIVVGPDYLQFENPLSKSTTGVDRPTIRLWIERALPLEKGKAITYSAAIGSTPPGELRRGFQTYVEDQRAHPFRTFLHYNSWYDIGYFTPYTATEAVNRIDAFCRELKGKRGVTIDSFLFDDGWDDRSGDWRFSRDFPQGFRPLSAAAAKCGAAPGIWLSPWGGYGKPKAERIAAGGGRYETADGGFALSGPRYYAQFHGVALDLLKQGVNQFKFDGTGNANSVVPGSHFDSDFGAAIALIEDLREARPDLFVNLTTGTYPSPAWLRYADTIWRDGQDHDFAGVGNDRERWITYRDQQLYENIAIAGPLFPLNAVMLHGIIYAEHAKGLSTDPEHSFAHEVHSYFGTGTALQELYVTPQLLSSADWDVLAATARWARDNGPILKDSHWIGGDPGRLEAYGWAAWSPKKAIVTLRNPDSRPQSFLLDLPRALELPAGAPTAYAAKSLWSGGASVPATLTAQPTVLTLAPFEVLTIELEPKA